MIAILLIRVRGAGELVQLQKSEDTLEIGSVSRSEDCERVLGRHFRLRLSLVQEARHRSVLRSCRRALSGHWSARVRTAVSSRLNYVFCFWQNSVLEGAGVPPDPDSLRVGMWRGARTPLPCATSCCSTFKHTAHRPSSLDVCALHLSFVLALGPGQRQSLL